MFGRSSGEPREYRFHHSIVRVKNYEKKKKRFVGGQREALRLLITKKLRKPFSEYLLFETARPSPIG